MYPPGTLSASALTGIHLHNVEHHQYRRLVVSTLTILLFNPVVLDELVLRNARLFGI